MKLKYLKLSLVVVLLLITKVISAQEDYAIDENRILYKIVDPETESIQLHYKDKNDSLINTLGNLKLLLESQNKHLVFGMNAGMYHPDYSPVGLYIEDGKLIKGIVEGKGSGNFSLKPNGIFGLRKNRSAFVIETNQFKLEEDILFATQSGPMLLIDGDFHPAFNKGSSNLYVRNGVGVTEDGKVIFAMSKGLINFYDFALFFKNKGCKNALYLDGSISQVYYPEMDWEQTSRKFGVLVSVTESKD